MDEKILNKNLHHIFEISILFKGLLAFFEILGGAAVFFTSKALLINTIAAITQDELSEDPKDFLSHYLIKIASDFSISTQHFVSFYLLSHGIIKLLLVIGLFKKKIWSYPVSITIFTFFIMYQLQRYLQTHSIWLLLITILDVTIIFLTWNEYKNIKKR